MPNKKFSAQLLMGVGVFLLASMFFLWPASDASAQCGSQASSCKNCHEVQGQDPVNSDGTGWHQSHAFGDFCYLCHGGNPQSMNADESHLGMVPPLSDIKASCQACHPTDLDAMAQVYATALGIEVGIANPETGNAEAPSASETSTNISIAPAEIDLEDPNLIDYAARYDELVLGKKPVNFGNAILIGLIALIALGGGGFVIKNEKWLDISSLDGKVAGAEYPTEVLEMLPAIMELQPKNRKILQTLLQTPDQFDKALAIIKMMDSKEQKQEGNQ